MNLTVTLKIQVRTPTFKNAFYLNYLNSYKQTNKQTDTDTYKQGKQERPTTFPRKTHIYIYYENDDDDGVALYVNPNANFDRIHTLIPTLFVIFKMAVNVFT